MGVEYDFARIVVDKDGEFTVWVERYDQEYPMPEDEVTVGQIECHQPMDAEELVNWLVDLCPNFRYPDSLTDEEIEEIRQNMREGEYYNG